MTESLQSTLAIPGQEFIATEYGRRLLVGSVVPEGLKETELLQVITALGQRPDDYPDILADYASVSSGKMSELFAIGEGLGSLVLKVSMPDSAVGIPTEARPIAPEPLVTHMRLMNALGHYLEKTTFDSLTTVPHHIALQIDDMHALTVMDYMADWTDLREWAVLKRLGSYFEERAMEIAAERVTFAVADTPFEDAIDDLFIPPEETGDDQWGFRGENVMIRHWTEYEDLVEAKLLVIDQPPIWKLEEALIAINAYEALGYRPSYLS